MRSRNSLSTGNSSWRGLLWIPVFMGMTAWAHAAANRPATITSDELELQNNGEITIFTGHVILKQDNYRVIADHMVRTKATGIVDADGHVVGTWISPKNEKSVVIGDFARYKPAENEIEIWGPRRVDVNLDGERGKAMFHGDRGWVSTLQPGKAKLMGQVTGHIIPAGAL